MNRGGDIRLSYRLNHVRHRQFGLLFHESQRPVEGLRGLSRRASERREPRAPRLIEPLHRFDEL